MKLSVVVPTFNEEENLPRLFDELCAVMDEHSLDAEVILVDDGSGDKSRDLIRAQTEKDPRFRGVLFARNYGQTAAMVAGIDHARGDVIVPLDADLQNDPKDIPRLLEKIAEGYDVVSGWRKNRQDRLLSRRLPSVLANRLIARVGGVHIHDYGCTLKAYKRDVLSHVRLYGEMHRFIPIYAHWAGGKVTELVVNHRPRMAGTSKYGIMRTFKVLLDLLTVKLLGSYATKPIYFFGGVGFLLTLSAVLVVLAAIVEKIVWNQFPHRFSMLVLGAFLALVGVQSVMMGLLAEMQVRTYHESQSKPIYIVRDRLGFADADLSVTDDAVAPPKQLARGV